MEKLIEKLRCLNEARKSYIIFLGEKLSDNAVFLKAHGITSSEKDIKIGEKYRELISSYEQEIIELEQQPKATLTAEEIGQKLYDQLDYIHCDADLSKKDCNFIADFILKAILQPA